MSWTILKCPALIDAQIPGVEQLSNVPLYVIHRSCALPISVPFYLIHVSCEFYKSQMSRFTCSTDPVGCTNTQYCPSGTRFNSVTCQCGKSYVLIHLTAKRTWNANNKKAVCNFPDTWNIREFSFDRSVAFFDTINCLPLFHSLILQAVETLNCSSLFHRSCWMH